MKMKEDFFKDYLKEAPLPLALERTLECRILSQKKFQRPILDIGCGEGLFAKKLFKGKIDVGIDPNDRELQRAKDHEAYEELILCKGDRIPKKDGTFNTILSNSVMEHIPEIDKVLREAHRLLSDQGTLYLTLPTSRFDEYTLSHHVLKTLRLKKLLGYHKRKFNDFWVHYHYYDTSEWVKKFEQLDFIVDECQEYGSKQVCLLNAVSTPFSLLSFVTKKLTNRWFISEKLRSGSAWILHALFKKFTLNPTVPKGSGGLVFFALKKATSK